MLVLCVPQNTICPSQSSALFCSTKPFESQNAESSARSLLSENRYTEAVSYLDLQLRILPVAANRLPILLLLADAQLGQGYLDDARATLSEAEALVARPSHERAISKRSANTSVRVRDGQTFTIGGLSLQADKNVQKKVPFLGDIPLLGYLFRYDKVETRDTEIVIFVSPHILKG